MRANFPCLLRGTDYALGKKRVSLIQLKSTRFRSLYFSKVPVINAFIEQTILSSALVPPNSHPQMEKKSPLPFLQSVPDEDIGRIHKAILQSDVVTRTALHDQIRRILGAQHEGPYLTWINEVPVYFSFFHFRAFIIIFKEARPPADVLAQLKALNDPQLTHLIENNSWDEISKWFSFLPLEIRPKANEWHSCIIDKDKKPEIGLETAQGCVCDI